MVESVMDLVPPLPPTLEGLDDLVEQLALDYLPSDPDIITPEERVEARRIAIEFLLDRVVYYQRLEELSSSPS